MIENLQRDARYASRTFRRAPLAALTIVATVGLGLGLVTVAFTLLNAFVFRVDEVRHPRELFEVARQQSADAPPATVTRPEWEALLRETSVFSDAFARTPDIDTWIDGRRMEGPVVTGNFFQVLGVTAALGRTFTPADDDPGGSQVLVLSYRAWMSQFRGDPGVIGRTIPVNGTAFEVIGIMPEGFRGLGVASPDFWAPLAFVAEFDRGKGTRPETAALTVIGRLRPGTSRGAATAALVAWDIRRAAERGVDRPVASLVLEPRTGTVPQPTEALLLFTPLFFAFGLILLIGCANVATLLLARGLARQREVGVRLALGASRSRVVGQLLTEGVLLSLVSAAVGFGISRLALSGAVHALTTSFPPDFGNLRIAAPPPDWRVALFLIGGALLSTLLFALMPALQATRVDLVRAMRGEVVRDARPRRTRDVLLGLQVTGAALLLIAAAVFLRSTWAAASVEPGIRTSDVLTLSVLDEQRRATVLDIVKREAAVSTIAAAWPGGLGGQPVVATGPAGRAQVTCQLVSPEYFEVLGIAVSRGRGFTAVERSPDHAVAIVAEDVARRLWPAGAAVGQTLRLDPEAGAGVSKEEHPLSTPRTVVVVGIARDVAGFRLGGARSAGAGVYLPTDTVTPRTSLVLRVHGDPDQARHTLVDRMAAVDPNMAEVGSLRTLARMEAYLLAIPFWLTSILGSLALVLTLSGLFSVLTYLVEQRAREIGVRLALGATGRDIVRLVLSQSARPVGAGLAAGSALTVAVSAALLATPAAEAIGSAVRLFDPLAYVASLLTIIAACGCAAIVPALRANRVDPVTALRQD